MTRLKRTSLPYRIRRMTINIKHRFIESFPLATGYYLLANVFLLILVSTWGCSSSSLFHRHKKTNTDEQLKQSLVHYEQGLRLEQEGKSDEAIAEYKKVIDISPRPAAYYHLGLIYATKGDYPTAISNFEKAIELVPTYDAAKKELERIKTLNK